MVLKISKITYDIKEKNINGKYYFVADNIKTLDAAKNIAEEHKKKRASSNALDHIEIWKTKDGMTTGLLLEI
jgi:hypothetical protein